ncbi:MAG: amidase [Dehalococcoidia bacterium]|nr:MAG: amidase [Dehalococcoidia bacterium]
MNETDICFLSAADLVASYQAKTLSPVEVTQALLARIDRLNPVLNAFVLVDDEGALASARAAEKAYASASAAPLAGVPVSIKDLTETRGMRTTKASIALKDWVPDFDAVVVERLRDTGACILGKTNVPEFGTTLITNNRLFGPARNPWNLERTAGGSSGGAAVAVASGLGSIGHGNDAGGSIRIPASFCGVFGIKPTMGRIPNNSNTVGMQLFAHEGPLTRTVGDAALFLSVCSGPDPRDPWAIEEEPPDFVRTLNEPLRDLRIAWSASFGGASTDPSVLAACQDAAECLAKRVGKGGLAQATPDLTGLAESFLPVFATDGYLSNIELVADRLDKSCRQVRQGFEWAKQLPATEYSLALGKIARFRYNTRRFFEEYDLLLTPVASVPPFRIDDPAWDIEHQIPPLEIAKFMFTPPFDVSGNPAASIPIGFTPDGLPVGLHVVGRWGEDDTVLRAARELERERPWAKHRPPEPA